MATRGERLKTILEHLFTRFFDGRAGMLYSYDVPERDSALPTPEEVAAGIPSAPGWGTGVEDCAMNGALLLAALGVAGLPEPAKGILAGLERLAAATGERGFVPRGLLPDGHSHYANTSGDQTNMLVCGLTSYAASRCASARDRSAIAGIVQAIAARLERDGFVLRHEDGSPASVGDLRAPGPGKAPRLLSILMAAYITTGDPHWRRLYEEAVCENDGARLRGLLPPAGFPPGWGFYAPEQMQAQLRLLADAEWDEERRAVYHATMREVARRMLGTGFPCEGHAPRYTDATRALLGDSAYLASPFEWIRYRPEIHARHEDWSWRGEFALEAPPDRSEAWALEFVLGWMGRRPAFCHERNCVRFPLTAFHVALLTGDAGLGERVIPECERLFATVDLGLCRWADTLVEAAAVCALLGSDAGMQES